MTLLTKQEVAQRLGCSIRTVDRLMKTGALPYFRPSAHIVRFDERDVEAQSGGRKSQHLADRRK